MILSENSLAFVPVSTFASRPSVDPALGPGRASRYSGYVPRTNIPGSSLPAILVRRTLIFKMELAQNIPVDAALVG